MRSPIAIAGVDWRSQLELIAQRIPEQNPDLVMLNEVKNWHWPWGGGINHVRDLSNRTGLRYTEEGRTTFTGIAGYKAVAVLSRWPLAGNRVHELPSGYAILWTTVDLNRMVHELFSPRFNAYSLPEQVTGLNLLAALVATVPSGRGVIAAGDFNCEVDQPHLASFVQHSGLRHAATEALDPAPCDPEHVIDHIFVRGPYRVPWTLRQCTDPNPSDHVWHVAELQQTAVPTGDQDWTHGPFYGQRGTYLANLDGDRRAEILVVNDDTVTARRNTGSRFGV